MRTKIDLLDGKIVDLLNQRAEVSLEIGKLKSKLKQPIYSPERESKVLARLAKSNKGPLNALSLEAIYREIMSSSLSLEKNIRISYLGPRATFTHLAALKKFGSSVDYIPANNIGDVFTHVEQDIADYGVVPVENSIEGGITHTLDMLVESSLKICAQVNLAVSHNVLARCKKENIVRIYSNPQVFGQCRLWLRMNLPRAELIEVSSTSRAAEIAKQENNSACIASALAAKVYKLKIIARAIEDTKSNITRFLVIGKNDASACGRDKTSIVFSVKDKVGALHDMLISFKKHRINLTKIESRPSKRKAWDYYFFVDLEGHKDEKNVAKALEQLGHQATYLRVLGSYPAIG